MALWLTAALAAGTLAGCGGSSDQGNAAPTTAAPAEDAKADTTAADEYVKNGTVSVTWNFTTMPSEEWKNQLGSAMLEYAQGTGNWDAVVTAFVDGWATEYQAANN